MLATPMTLKRISSTMARTNASLTFCKNTIQENIKILQDSRTKTHVIQKSGEELRKLFTKLNYNCQVRAAKDEGQQCSPRSSKHTKVATYVYGPVAGFPPGSWWGILMDCSRDRVHDPFDQDVQNGPFGVTSVCTSNTGANEDVDLGDCLTITGGKYIEGEPCKSPIMINYENQVPIRLIRCYNLLNEYAPKTGYRYDGLYAVTRFWIGVSPDAKKYYKFALVRLVNQEPAAWTSERSARDVHYTGKSMKTSTEHSGNYEFRKNPYNETRKRGKHDGASETTKFVDSEHAILGEKSKTAPESVIVTRHVFKKNNASVEIASTSNASSTSEGKSLLNIDQGSKAQSTNISIRMGLYDSSNSIQHDNKKNILSSYPRPVKPLTILKTNLHAENHSHSKSEVKIEMEKVSNKSQLAEIVDLKDNVENLAIPKPIEKDPLVAINDNSLKGQKTGDSASTTNLVSNTKNVQNSNTQSDTNIESPLKTEETPVKVKKKLLNNVCNSVHLANTMYQDIPVADSKKIEENHENVAPINECSTLHTLKPLELLDSLTPDKILHLISKEKYHPLSRMLMGNMLGFTSEQTMALRTLDVLKLHAELTTKENAEKKNFKAVNDDLLGGRCYKFKRRKRMTRKLLNKSDSKLKNYAQPVSILGQCTNQHDSDEDETSTNAEEELKKENTKNTKEIRPNERERRKTSTLGLYTNRLRHDVTKRSIKNDNTVRTRLKSVQAIRSSVKKHIHRKKRREIANLLIDAKIGPKVRGPRNRRLRSINTIYTKRPYESFSTIIRNLSSRKVNSNMLDQQATFTGKNKLEKVKRQTKIPSRATRTSERSDALTLKRRGMKEVDKEEEEKELKNENNNVTNNRFIDRVPTRSRKRKSTPPVTVDVNCNGIKDDGEENPCKETAKPPCTVDATIQCSLLSEDFQCEVPILSRISMEGARLENYFRLNRRNGQQDCIKLEGVDPQDMKVELPEGSVIASDEKYEIVVLRREKNSACSVGCSSEKTTRTTSAEIRDSPVHRSSAFVPVNTLDSDLRIARLRSIGFKPISSVLLEATEKNSSTCYDSKVVKQDVAEKYNKYTNEENSLVIYMDDELQYQDIEKEVENEQGRNVASKKRRKMLPSETSSEEFGDTRHTSCADRDLEAPWHGWKKVVTSKDSYWIGW